MNWLDNYKKIFKEIQQNPIGLVVEGLVKNNIYRSKPENSVFALMVQNIDWDPYEHTLEDVDFLRKKHFQKLSELCLPQSALMVHSLSVLNNVVVVTWIIIIDDLKCFEQMA